MSSAQQDFWTAIKATSRSFGDHRRKYDPHDSDDENTGKDSHEAVPTAKYQYTDLSNAENCIRLLELQPGHRYDTIICQLKEISLDASVNQYDALSYVWGIPGGESTPIQVNDGSLIVGSSLHEALKHLRYPDRPRFLWVDAICINQSSIWERNIQVPMMCEIYRNAACTVCFLGPERRTTRSMYAMLEELAQESKALEVDDPTYDAMDTIPAFVNHLPVHPVKTKLFDKYVGDYTIIDIAQRKWWHRAWTVQELMLSSNAIMMTGRYTITWKNLCAAVDHGLNTRIWGTVMFGAVMNPVVVPYISMRALMVRYHRPNQLGSPAVDLLHLLAHCRHRESTDARDKIYAVLGLLRDTHPEALRPESSDALDVELGYSYDVVYVYRKMCQELIQKLGNLDVLGICPKTTRPLPSWATDWSIMDSIGSPLMQDSLDRTRTTHAAKHTKANARFADDGACMIISGYELTSVVALAETLPVPVIKNRAGSTAEVPIDIKALIPDLKVMAPNTNGIYDTYKAKFKIFMALFKFIFKIIIIGLKLQCQLIRDDSREFMSVFNTLFAWERFADAQPPTNPGVKSDEVYWQTLCAGTYKNGSTEETGMLFKTWSDLLQPLRKFMEYHPHINEKLPMAGMAIYMRATWQSYGEFWPYTACSQHRRLGRAANGWLCLLPEETKVGDLVFIASGGRVPLIIRPGKNGHNTFVGEAYVHGIMDGEAFDEGNCVDVEIR
ncbi:uncharacterized protein PAC_15331 [Phialocephala subalpina]|uniref:Heterokaryon incompatibility domain-containing protein n=1 Tax=Phialocephala subalpina TaxID=576137 RepID=A0A1L7XK45_9HELO|nr:uncharacterized protein PAC_15331 [Phialocephala subalpina]